MTVQMNIFGQEEDTEERKRKMIEEQLKNLRRGIFARYDKLVAELAQVQEDISYMQESLKIKPPRENDKIMEFPFTS